jgi:hypothetical protein
MNSDAVRGTAREVPASPLIGALAMLLLADLRRRPPEARPKPLAQKGTGRRGRSRLAVVKDPESSPR